MSSGTDQNNIPPRFDVDQLCKATDLGSGPAFAPEDVAFVSVTLFRGVTLLLAPRGATIVPLKRVKGDQGESRFNIPIAAQEVINLDPTMGAFFTWNPPTVSICQADENGVPQCFTHRKGQPREDSQASTGTNPSS